MAEWICAATVNAAHSPGSRPANRDLPEGALRKTVAQRDCEVLYKMRKEIQDPGAKLVQDGVHYRVWALEHERVEARIHAKDGQPPRVIPLQRQEDGFFEAKD